MFIWDWFTGVLGYLGELSSHSKKLCENYNAEVKSEILSEEQTRNVKSIINQDLCHDHFASYNLNFQIQNLKIRYNLKYYIKEQLSFNYK